MDIKDLAGLSQPLKQLVKNVSKGTGKIFDPILNKKNTDATVYEIEKISKALQNSPHRIEYKSENVTILSEQNNISHEIVQHILELHDRAVERTNIKEIQRQLNVEKIISNAAEELSDETKIPEVDLDEDWLNRFFRTAEDISSDKMQHLWAKILSEEHKKPGSFSLRTLETLKSITQTEAEIFSKVGKYAFTTKGSAYLINDYDFLKNNLSASNIVTLQEVGLIHSSNNYIFKINEANAGDTTALFMGDYAFLLKRKKNTNSAEIDALIFTSVGNELLSLIQKEEKEFYIPLAQLLYRKLKNLPGITASIGLYEYKSDDIISFDDDLATPITG